MRSLHTVIIILFSTAIAFSQCNEFYQFSDGSEWEMKSYNAKDKLTGRNTQKVTEFTGGSDSFTAKVYSVMYDKKDKEVMQGDLEFKCEGGTMIVDMRNFINDEQLKMFESYDVKVEAENLEVPSGLSVGQTLKDGSVTVIANDSPLPMNMTVNITDRKVVGKESITTPAGTFECFKITSKSNVKTKMGLAMSFEFTTTEWLAPEVAIVRSESYKGGKLQGYSVLTERK